ncbi:MAG: murein transglycosylase domain-containing protein [Humidesulfovibrio sp.]|uniref:murein transglycosylase domain-containing protein n=1 Tax=Humidesulfovibrio sp. TaxID=2910988 RepID=UPI0027327EF4|nr:murein transglycosylase domain-containing protein [Humidesulfovibrio sp.]MDP2847722.1 murein transglycosylase domain-containing protein [Humidesulfovibrio sp.]
MKRHVQRSPRTACAALLALCFCANSCSASDAISIARVASGDTSAAIGMARSKAVRYAANPSAIEADYKRFKSILSTFRRAVSGNWGKDDAREPEPKQYVKYTQNYLSRASVDFENGRILVETLDQDAPVKSLREAIVTTLLTPYDPRAVDMYSSGPVQLGGTPFLLGEVKDQRGHNIRTEDQAEAFARHLLAQGPEERPASVAGKTVHYVSIPMAGDHLQVRASKFRPQVEAAARRFGISRTLVYAIIRVESDFNPYAINTVPAVGLMQVVPQTAGSDVHEFLTQRRGEPSKAFLFEPDNNVVYGTAYLHLLYTRHLPGVVDPISREYCVIASYNGGSGALLKTFNRDRSQALHAINSRPPTAVYDTITQKHAAEETRQYLRKVLEAKKQFVGL